MCKSISEKLYSGIKQLKNCMSSLGVLIDNVPNQFDEYRFAAREFINPHSFFDISYHTQNVWELITEDIDKSKEWTDLMKCVCEALDEHANKRLSLYGLIQETVNLSYAQEHDMVRVLNELVCVLNDIDATLIEILTQK